MRILALDYGAARTGVAVSDATGTIATPLGVVERAGTATGLARIRDLVAEHDAELVSWASRSRSAGSEEARPHETDEFVACARGGARRPDRDVR